MSEDSRTVLENQTIYIRKQEDSTSLPCTIVNVFSKDEESILYNAILDGVPGYLREFYPLGDDFYNLSRTSQNYLKVDPERPKRNDEDNFQTDINEYIKKFERYLLDYEKFDQDSLSQNRVPYSLSLLVYNSAPNLSVYESLDKKATKYIWTPRKSFGPTLVDFIEKLKADHFYTPEDKLFLLLSAIYELAAYVNAFLKIGSYQLDYHGDNFYVLTAEDEENDILINELETNNSASVVLTLNNINFKKTTDSETYIEDFLSYVSDILQDTIDFKFRISKEDQLAEEFSDGELEVNLINSLDEFIQFLIDLYLSVCLADDIDELLKILEKAFKFYTKTQQNREIRNFIFKAKGNTFRRNVILNGFLKYPLGQVIPKNQEEIDILILGGGAFGFEFIDQVLPTSQIIGKSLNLYIYDNKEVHQKYLANRPELETFLNIYSNGKLISECSKNHKPLANLFFYSPDRASLPLSDSQTIHTLFEGKGYDYCFVSLGNDDLNQKTVLTLNSILKKSIPILFPTEKIYEESDEKTNNDILKGFPLEIRRLDTIVNPVVLRLAFNFMIIAENKFNTNVAHLRKKTLELISSEKYPYDSPVIDVVALLNNLYALGILQKNIMTTPSNEIDQLLKEAARLFYKTYISDSSQRSSYKFVELFHYVSVLKRAVKGFKNLNLESISFVNNPEILERMLTDKLSTDLVWIEDSYNFSLKDQQAILKGQLDLTDRKYEYYDELDRASLTESFRFNEYRIKVLQRTDNSIINRLNILERTIEDYYNISDISKKTLDNLLDKLHKVEFGFKNISSGNSNYSRRFEDILLNFIEEVSNIQYEHFGFMAELGESIQEIFKDINQFIGGSDIIDFKKQRHKLYLNIPFILTNQDDAVLINFLNISGQKNKPDKLFPNVASACLILPQKIDYYYIFNDSSSFEELKSQFPLILNFLRERKIGKVVHLTILYSGPENQEELRTYKEDYEVFKNDLTEEYGSFLEIENLMALGDKIKDVLIDQLLFYPQYGYTSYVDLTNQIFRDQFIQADFIKALQNDVKIPSFQFDSRYMKFFNNDSCKHLDYIDTSRFYLRIQELFTLGNRDNGILNLPEFQEEFTTLWELYNGSYLKKDNEKESKEQALRRKRNGVKTWNRLSDLINKTNLDKETKKSYVGSFIPNTDFTKTADILEKEYYLPNYAYNTVSYLINLLKNNGVIDKSSYILSDINGTCKIKVHFYKKNKHALDRLFSNPTYLVEKKMLDYYFEPSKDGSRRLKIKFVDLKSYQIVIGTKKVSEVPSHRELREINNGYLKSGALNRKRLLEALAEKGLITHLKFKHYYKRNQKKIYTSASFYYSSKRVKNILESAGKVFEIYAFYKLLEDGYFDDIINGYEILFDKPGNKESEIDLILTKGFRSYVIECKATSQLSRKYYLSLSSLGEAYGINNSNILLHYDFTDNTENFDDIHEFGSQLNAQTITLTDNVSELAEIIKKIDQSLLERGKNGRTR